MRKFTALFFLIMFMIGTVMMFLGGGTLLGSLISAYAVRKIGGTRAVVSGMSMLVVLYAVTPHLSSPPIVTAFYLIIFATLGMIFPIVMEALASLNASVRGTISCLANSTMNGANTLGDGSPERSTSSSADIRRSAHSQLSAWRSRSVRFCLSSFNEREDFAGFFPKVNSTTRRERKRSP